MTGPSQRWSAVRKSVGSRRSASLRDGSVGWRMAPSRSSSHSRTGRDSAYRCRPTTALRQKRSLARRQAFPKALASAGNSEGFSLSVSTQQNQGSNQTPTLATSADRTGLQPNSLQTGNFTGKTTIARLIKGMLVRAVPQGLFGRFPK